MWKNIWYEISNQKYILTVDKQVKENNYRVIKFSEKITKQQW